MNSKSKTISPIKIINQNTVQKIKNNSQLSESDTNDVFNYEWTEVVSPKSHKRLNSDKQSHLSKSIKTTTNTQFSSHNKFSVLSQNDVTDMETNEANEIISKLPPPIFIKTKVQNYQQFCEKIKNIIEPTDNFTCKSSTESIKINTTSSNAYRTIIKYLKDAKAKFFTYQLKENKPYRIVIRNLHPTTPPDYIKEELENEGYQVRNVTNALHRVSKIKLPLFFVDLEPALHNKNIFELQTICYTKVKIEAPRINKLTPQCLNCQNYGHTRTYCNNHPRCVRCGENHRTDTCTKDRDLPAKCALCNGDHPANYRGCLVFKNLQQLRKKQSPSKSNTDKTEENTNHKNPTLYNQSLNSTSHPNNSNNSQTYSKATLQNKNPIHTNNEHQNQQNVDMTTQLTSFLNEFKSLINPLISLLTTVIDKLLMKNVN